MNLPAKKKAKKRRSSLDNFDLWSETKITKINPSCSEFKLPNGVENGPEQFFEPSIFLEIDETKACDNSKHNSVIEEFIDDDFIVNQNCTIISPKITNETKANRKVLPNNHNGDLERTYSGSLQSIDCEYYSYCTYPNGSFIILEKGTIHFYGLMEIRVVYGVVEVLGHILSKDSPPAKLYSPRGHALLYLTNPKAPSDTEDLVYNFYPNLRAHEPEKRVNSNCCIIECTKLDEKSITFVEKHISQQILPKLDNPDLPAIIVEPLGFWNTIKTHPDWNLALKNILSSSKLMICGGKGVGKSLFLRYAINKLLNDYSKIRVIDLDPGQSEFTTPGCISVVTVEQPVFGPNFTHLKRPDRSILSNISISYDPKKYIESTKALLNGFNSLDPLPTLINYMGYTDDIGINIISSAICVVQPTDLIQINSSNPKKNFKVFLQPEVVKLNSTLFYPESHLLELDYNFLVLESMSIANTGWSIEPRQGREMCLLSYFGEFVSEKLSIYDLPMFETNLSSVKLCNGNGEIISPGAINANLIALCAIQDKDKKIFQCYGWGIVRGIDINNDKIVLLTSEQKNLLDKVDYLVLNGLLLPPSIYMTPDESFGEIPYVVSGDLMSFGQITKRTIVPPKNNNFVYE